MIKFTIGGRTVNPNDIGDALMQAALEGIKEQLRERIGSIRDPDTGEFPTLIVRGDDLESLTIQVEGSPKLVALVEERLGAGDDEDDEEQPMVESQSPRAFVCWTGADREHAEQLATALHANGIDTWWSEWCINAGDSLRQKIEEGLGDRTHFLALLTPNSVSAPWVNLEIDAALVRRLENKCKLIPVRRGLSVSEIPLLLRGMYSPEFTSYADIARIVSDIHGVSRKPPLGAPPPVVTENAGTKNRYSPTANAIAKLLVTRSEHGYFGDPQFSAEDVAREAGLSAEDVEDGLYELRDFVDASHDHVMPRDGLFAEFDQYWMEWKPADDARRLAADLVNGPDFPAAPKVIAERYGWKPRRFNSAITYLRERRLIVDYQTIGTAPYIIAIVEANEHTRRFVKSRS